jgi:TonB family protein
MCSTELFLNSADSTLGILQGVAKLEKRICANCFGTTEAKVKARRIILILAWGLLVSQVAAPALQTTTEQPQGKTARAVPVRIRIGGNVMRARLVHEVNPKYPEEARKKHIKGTVRVEIVVDRDGKVIETNVLSGDPLLAKAATEALREWRYQPTLLNREPIQVLTEVDLKLDLHRPSM